MPLFRTHMILWMEEILHQLIGSLSHCFVWVSTIPACRISCIHSSSIISNPPKLDNSAWDDWDTPNTRMSYEMKL